jgi:hypothetical protein
MDVNSDAFDAAQSPQVIAMPTLARRTTQDGPSNKRQNFCARQFSTPSSAEHLNSNYPNCQVHSVRTKATRTDPKIFAIFVRTPVFSRTIFVRTQRDLRAHRHHLRAHSGIQKRMWGSCAVCARITTEANVTGLGSDASARIFATFGMRADSSPGHVSELISLGRKSPINMAHSVRRLARARSIRIYCNGMRPIRI